jgi:hypothetical protein
MGQKVNPLAHRLGVPYVGSRVGMEKGVRRGTMGPQRVGWSSVMLGGGVNRVSGTMVGIDSVSRLVEDVVMSKRGYVVCSDVVVSRGLGVWDVYVSVYRVMGVCGLVSWWVSVCVEFFLVSCVGEVMRSCC